MMTQPSLYVEKILGFDAREMWVDTQSFWDQSRKNDFLLRSNVEKVLSVDDYVWLRVFDINSGGSDSIDTLVGSNQKFKRLDEYLGPVWDQIFDPIHTPYVPSWTGQHGLWDHLELIENSLNQSWGKSWKPCCIVGISQFVNQSETELLDEFSQYDIKPSAIDQNWTFLGYDVADFYLTSFISNAGYTEDEKKELGPVWAPVLNKHHLFDSFEKATEYVDVAYARDERHGPFYVYGLYLIEKID